MDPINVRREKERKRKGEGEGGREREREREGERERETDDGHWMIHGSCHLSIHSDADRLC